MVGRLSVRGIATVSYSVLAPVVVGLAPLLTGMLADYPNQLGAAGEKVAKKAKIQSKVTRHMRTHRFTVADLDSDCGRILREWPVARGFAQRQQLSDGRGGWSAGFGDHWRGGYCLGGLLPP